MYRMEDEEAKTEAAEDDEDAESGEEDGSEFGSESGRPARARGPAFRASRVPACSAEVRHRSALRSRR